MDFTFSPTVRLLDAERRAGTWPPHFSDEEAEAQRGDVTGREWHQEP